MRTAVTTTEYYLEIASRAEGSAETARWELVSDGTIRPTTNDTGSLGSSAKRWGDLFVTTLDATEFGNHLIPATDSTWDVGSSAKRVRKAWLDDLDAGGTVTFGAPLPVASGGTGVATFAANGVLYGNAATSVLVTAQGGANTVLTANDGAPSFSTTPTVSAITLARGTLTDPASNITTTVTWNDVADTFTAISVQITDTASATASKAVDVLVGGNTVWRLRKDGGTFQTATVDVERASSSVGAFVAAVAADPQYRFIAYADGYLAWGPGNVVQDTVLYRDSANVLKTDDAFYAVGNITTEADLLWKSGTAFTGTFAHAIGADRTWTLPDVAGTVVTTGNLTDITATGTVASGTWQGTGVGDTYLATDVARMNQATNGSHTFWQRGTGAFTANNAYAADRKQIILAGTDTISVSQEATTKPANARYSSALTFTLGDGAGASRYKERLVISDGFHHLLGQAISIRLAVRSNAASATRAFITTDGTGGTSNYSSYHAGDSAFADLTVTNITVPSDATYIDYGNTLEATATIYTSNWMLNRGAIAANFQALTPSEELQRAHRYCYLTGGTSQGHPMIARSANGAFTDSTTWAFPVQMAVAPTVTLAGTWAVSNCGQPSVSTATTTGFRLDTAVTGAGAYYYVPDSADDVVTAVANP